MIRAARSGCPGLVEVKLVPGIGDPIGRRIGNPAVDLRFTPASAVNADRYLRRERPFGDLAIDSRARQSGAMKDGFEADDTVWFWHVRNSIAWRLMTLPAMKLTASLREKRVSPVQRIAAQRKRRAAANIV